MLLKTIEGSAETFQVNGLALFWGPVEFVQEILFENGFWHAGFPVAKYDITDENNRLQC